MGDMYPKEDTCKEDKEEEGQETYMKLSVTHVTKGGI